MKSNEIKSNRPQAVSTSNNLHSGEEEEEEDKLGRVYFFLLLFFTTPNAQRAGIFVVAGAAASLNLSRAEAPKHPSRFWSCFSVFDRGYWFRSCVSGLFLAQFQHISLD